MKRALTLLLLAGGLMFAGTSDANAQDCYRGGRSGFGFSLNYGSAYRGGGFGNPGFSPYRSRSFTRVTPRRYVNRSFYSGPGFGVPSYGYTGFGGYGGYGYGNRCGW